MNQNTTPASAFACGQINPFDHRSVGGKIPDFCNMPTGCLTYKASTVVVTDAAGYAAGFFSTPDRGVWHIRPSAIVAGTITWASVGTSTLPNWSATSSFFDMHRTVSYGIRVTCDQSLLNASGHVYLACAPLDLYNEVYGYTDMPISESEMESIQGVVKISIAELATRPFIVPAKIQDAGITGFLDTNAPAAAENSIPSGVGWSAIVYYVSGASASTNLLSFEYIAHLEVLVGPGSNGILEASTCCYNPEVLAVVSSITANNPTAHADNSDTVDGYLNKIEGLIDTISSNAGRAANVVSRIYSGGRALHSAYGAGVQRLGRNSPIMIKY